MLFVSFALKRNYLKKKYYRDGKYRFYFIIIFVSSSLANQTETILISPFSLIIHNIVIYIKYR